MTEDAALDGLAIDLGVTMKAVALHLSNDLEDLRGGSSEPLLLPNVWDVASAHAVAGAGFPVIATSGLAVAATPGFSDADISYGCSDRRRGRGCAGGINAGYWGIEMMRSMA